MTERPGDVGDAFQRGTRHSREGTVGWRPGGGDYPGFVKHFSDAPSVALPRVKDRGGPSLWTAMGTRRSRRGFTSDPLSLEHLSQLCWAAQGVTAEMHGLPLRTTPSAGGLYPIETYVVANRVAGLERGVYHYYPVDHSLERLAEGDYGAAVAHAALDQGMCARAPAVFVWTAIVQRSRMKYGQRCYRYIYLDAGHVGHSVALAAEGLGLGLCAVGAFYDDEVEELVGADGEEEVAVYLACVGHCKR
jgi:SagB-type dehydrogenase family enzyme